jgi:hypothetical protein
MSIDKAFDLEKGRAFQVVMLAIVGTIAIFSSALLGIPALILLVVAALGKVYESWDAITAAVAKVGRRYRRQRSGQGDRLSGSRKLKMSLAKS